VTNCSVSSLRPGLAAGAGVEWGITSNWSAKPEYIYVATMGAALSVDRLDTVRAGINYRFGGI
jgi:outer membrane immunogenic protein